MQKKSLFTVGLVVISITVTAQKINTDSLSIISKISEYQLKRAKLQNTIQQTTWDKQDAATKVQISADKNSQDANRLNNDPQNKKLAKDADNSASDARKDSKSARNANKKLADLNKAIAELDSKISDQQQKLSAYTNVVPATTPVVMPATAPVVDTTHRS
jgi:chromosome segregation ATPase